MEITEETIRGLYLILSSVPDNHDGAQVYKEAIPIMNKAHKAILEIAREKDWDCRGGDLAKMETKYL